MAKVVLFADGTGNARTARFRTNVWKLYAALDGRPDSGQLAYYHDGVGTSAFAPLRILGGIFGIGLGRNIQSLYAFLCRNYGTDGDEIHLFGFSRGAFTVRILAGLIHHEGIRHICDEAELASWVRDAYRRNRLRLASEQMGAIRRMIVRAGAALLDIAGQRPWSAPQRKPEIAMVGVWDTVAAYGGPIIEMVRGFDRWIWPLSMPDYKLCASVRRARHAMSLDEEREAFLPLPWDEVSSDKPERIKQVWFAGVHSDVGGGYADDGLSSIALAWMLDEAKAAGLTFFAAAEATIRENANAWAPMHDSRSGLAVGYRYQPRSINALMGLTPNSPLRDPESGNKPLMNDVVIHKSVMARVRGSNGYAPIVLPTVFRVGGGEHIKLPATARNKIWGRVRTRQLYQRMLLATTAVALFAPLLPKPPWIVVGDQLLSPVLGAVLAFVPFLPDWLRTAYAAAGSWLSVCAIAIALWLVLGEGERTQIDKLSSGMWRGEVVIDAGNIANSSAEPTQVGRLLCLTLALRRRLRWVILPGVFGIAFYVAALLFLITVVNQGFLIWDEMQGDLCPGTPTASAVFATAEPCHHLGQPVLGAHRYRVRLSDTSGWSDSKIVASPLGFTYLDSISQGWATGGFLQALKGGVVHFFGMAIRREIGAQWFQPVIAIRSPGSNWLYKINLSPRRGGDGNYYAHFIAPVDGDTSIYVNDTLVPGRPANSFYINNKGTARVEIVEED